MMGTACAPWEQGVFGSIKQNQPWLNLFYAGSKNNEKVSDCIVLT